MFKYCVLFLLLVAFGAADEESKSDSSSAEIKELLGDLRGMLELVKNECAKETEAVNNIASASEHLKTNVQPDLQKKLSDAFNNSSKEGSDDVVVPLCEGLDQVRNIYVNLTGYLVPCLEKDDMKTLQVTYKMFDGLIKYTCVSHRSDIIDFLENGGAKCVTDKSTELEACGNSAFGSILDDSSEKTEGNKSDEDIDFAITKEHCDMFKSLKTCVNKTLKDCPFKAASSTLEGFIDTVLTEMPCYKAEGELDNTL